MLLHYKLLAVSRGRRSKPASAVCSCSPIRLCRAKICYATPSWGTPEARSQKWLRFFVPVSGDWPDSVAALAATRSSKFQFTQSRKCLHPIPPTHTSLLIPSLLLAIFRREIRSFPYCLFAHKAVFINALIKWNPTGKPVVLRCAPHRDGQNRRNRSPCNCLNKARIALGG